MQRSEGGGLGVGGSSSGFMTARGAADFLTRATAILGGSFIVLSIALAAFAGASRAPATVDTSLANSVAPAPAASAPTAPVASQSSDTNAPATANQAAPATNNSAPVPLAQ
jgi:preprotein translocase subunit SecG